MSQGNNIASGAGSRDGEQRMENRTDDAGELVCWTLSGLRRQCEREVWVLLGTYPSESAAGAASAADWTIQGVSETRVMPYYRAARLRPHVRPATPAVAPLKPHAPTVA